VELLVRVPVPSWPEDPLPQQYAAPLVVTPHADPSPALTSEKLRPPATAAGVAVPVLVPVPRLPFTFTPQQYAAPLVATPHANPFPVLADPKLNPPPTATGIMLQAAPPHDWGPIDVPVPSSP